jgi:hypothetical protein
MSGLQLTGITIVFVVMLALISVGVYNIHRGLALLPEAERLGQDPVWHRQPNVLLGISNIAFAILIGLAALFGTGAADRNVMLVLIVLVFLFSVFLVIRTALSALKAIKNLHEKQQTNKNDKP